MNEILPELGEICKKYATLERNSAYAFMQSLECITKYKGENRELADHLDDITIPLYEKYLGFQNSIEVEDEQGFLLKSSKTGFLTVKDNQNNVFYHSVQDPMWEAYVRVKEVFNPEKEVYSVCGCGLGYIPFTLYLISYGSVKIKIYDSNPNMIEYARHYGVLDWIPEENLEICVSDNPVLFLESLINENTGHILDFDACSRMKNPEKKVLMDLYFKFKTSNMFKKDRLINLYRNLRSEAKWITELKNQNVKKKILVIAAGPSLDQSMDSVRKNRNEFTVICVGTVLKKLLKEGIAPDYVTINDPQERTVRQIEGVENIEIPMLLGLMSYWEFARKYHGDKYLVPTMGDMDLAESIIQEKNQKPWFCGGTVAGLAFAVAKHFNPDEIYMAGYDFSYPNGMSHAVGTMDYKSVNTDNMWTVTSVTGEKVYTDRLLDSYRKDVEKMIEESKGIKYYNMSKTGARIKGACTIELP